ncbi:TPA: segregation/condensation protein A [Candidatus Avigastranaerophilus faecigallinarum]|nr:segregation/condensation protein A [Candidatus Avigastranaerophilus faecigallinarum]
MLNPKDTENFYMQTTTESYTKDLGFSPDSILDSPSDELDGIEVLVQMAKQGKIDPWNIDIADIADKYMLHIAESKSNNLRVTGRALFFLAVLLKLKSNILVGIDPMQFEVQEEINPEYDDTDDSRFSDDLYYQDYYPDNVIPIEDVIQRRTSVKLNRNRIVTLKDLIRQLEFYEQLDKKQAVKNSLERAKRRVRNYANMSADDIINLAHEEYIENSVKILHENLIKIFEKEEKVELNTLTLLGLDKISAYIALLFLTAESDFDLEQEEFYSDLYVVKGQTPTVNVEEKQTA